MTDPVLVFDEENKLLDLNFSEGQLVLITVGSTEDQRAAVCAYTGKGTIPGLRSEGVDWSSLYTQEQDITQIDNTIRQDIAKYAKENITKAGQGAYTPIYQKSADVVSVGVIKT